MQNFESNKEMLEVSVKMSKASFKAILFALKMILQVLKGNYERIKNYQESEKTLQKQAELKHTHVTGVQLNDSNASMLSIELNKLGISYSITPNKDGTNTLNFHANNSEIVQQKLEKVLDKFEKSIKPTLNERIKEAKIKQAREKMQKKTKKKEKKLKQTK